MAASQRKHIKILVRNSGHQHVGHFLVRLVNCGHKKSSCELFIVTRRWVLVEEKHMEEVFSLISNFSAKISEDGSLAETLQIKEQKIKSSSVQ